MKGEPIIIAHLWLTLGDPVLNSLVERTVVANRARQQSVEITKARFLSGLAYFLGYLLPVIHVGRLRENAGRSAPMTCGGYDSLCVRSF